jgi:hypothetical protein
MNIIARLLLFALVAGALVGCNTANPSAISAGAQPAITTASGAAVPVSALEAQVIRHCPNAVDTATLLTFAASFQHNAKVSDGVALAAKIVRAACAAFS